MVLSLIIVILLRVIRVYSFLLVAYALLSWFPGAYQSAFGRLLSFCVEPLIRPFRKLPLQIGGLDFTIWVVAIVLNIVSDLLIGILV